MRRFPFAVLLAAAGCIHGSPAPQRDSNALRATNQPARWAQDALSRRPDRTELQAIRSSDFTAVGRGRGELKRLLQAIDRATWIRNTAAELMLDDADPQLAATFDRAARMRADAILAADELASALAEAKGGLTIGDLRPGLEAVRKAQASEDRIARLTPRAGGRRLAPAALPVPRPFLASAARLVAANPELTRELDRLAPDDAAQIRARLADVNREKEEAKRAEPAAAPSPAPPAARRAARPRRRALRSRSARRPAARCAGAGRRGRRRSPSIRADRDGARSSPDRPTRSPAGGTRARAGPRAPLPAPRWSCSRPAR